MAPKKSEIIKELEEEGIDRYATRQHSIRSTLSSFWRPLPSSLQSSSSSSSSFSMLLLYLIEIPD